MGEGQWLRRTHAVRGKLGERGLFSLAGRKPGWRDKLTGFPTHWRIASRRSVTRRVLDSVEEEKGKMRNDSFICC